jgi:diaminopimelate decarboxylase/aspartate kinase
VKVIAPCAAITLVGRGMRSLLHKLSDVWATFGRERVHLISQSSNDLNLTFVIDEADADGMLPQLHAELIAAARCRCAMPACSARAGARSRTARSARATPWWQRRATRCLRIAQAGTPRYVYDLATVRDARAALRDRAIDRCFYAIKANPHPAILRTLVERRLRPGMRVAGRARHVFATCRTWRRSGCCSRPASRRVANTKRRSRAVSPSRSTMSKRCSAGPSCSATARSGCASTSVMAKATTRR